MSREIANLFASKFIARPDVKAIQHNDGSWSPHTDTGKRDGARIPWRREDLEAHISGTKTFGHYLVSSENKAKLFAFDIDLNKSGALPEAPQFSEDDDIEVEFSPVEDLRGAWLNRAHPARWFMKYEFKMLASKLAGSIVKDLELPCAVAYSGNKGVHVYAFTGLIPAKDAREGARIVLDSVGGFELIKGEHFFMHPEFSNLSIEVYPKQDDLAGKDLGNLMRLPLGKHLKNPKDPTFFLDLTVPMAEFKPVDPIKALSSANPWE